MGQFDRIEPAFSQGFPSIGALPTLAVGVIGTNGTSATANAAVNLPTGRRANDLLMVLHRCSDGTAAHGYPGSWNELLDDNSDGSANRMSIAWKVADGTEGSTITVTQTSSKFASIAWAIRGSANPNLRPPEMSALATGSSTTPNPNNLTPTGGAKDYLWLWMGGWEGEQTSPPASTPAAPFTTTTYKIGADSGTAGVVTTNCRVASIAAFVNQASLDAGSWTISVTDDWMAVTIAVHPDQHAPAIVSHDAVRRASLW